MALYGYSGAIDRIRKTKQNSPVVVMTTDKYDDIKGPLFDVFFYETVYGHRVEHQEPFEYIGKFHKLMPPNEVMDKLREALKRL